MENKEVNEFEEWTTTELFEYLVAAYVVSQDEEFEDWKNCRTDLLKMCEN